MGFGFHGLCGECLFFFGERLVEMGWDMLQSVHVKVARMWHARG